MQIHLIPDDRNPFTSEVFPQAINYLIYFWRVTLQSQRRISCLSLPLSIQIGVQTGCCFLTCIAFRLEEENKGCP